MTRAIYIAGPMRGIPLWNFPAFDAARDYIATVLTQKPDEAVTSAPAIRCHTPSR